MIDGGETPSVVTNRTLELAGGKSAKIAVLPAANLGTDWLRCCYFDHSMISRCSV